ncbi:hypothetical protein ABZY68_25315 [Streptomyces sp. NPDC006482]|uniref:hypothetical protein n=1 Tax=Streptomyces sp. NPDC006482 TaxID=3154306 RepID=UPI0033AFECAD
MSEHQTETAAEPEGEKAPRCAYPQCENPPVPKDTSKPGTRPKYCADPDHNAMSAYRAKQKRPAGVVQAAAEEQATDQIVTDAASTAVLVQSSVLAKVEGLKEELGRYVSLLQTITDPEAAEAQVAAAETRADARIAEAHELLTKEKGRRENAERKAKTSEDARVEAEEAADQAIDELEAAKGRFETETARIQDEAEQQVAQAQADAKVSDIQRRAEERVTAAETAAGQALAQVEEMKTTVEQEKASAEEVRAAAAQVEEDARKSVRAAQAAQAEAERSARQAAVDAQTRIDAIQTAADRVSEELHGELERTRTDLATSQARVTTLETTTGELYAEIRAADGRVRDAEEKARDKDRELQQLRGKR